MRHELRMAIRVLAKSPGATALSVLSIALGIGLTAGMFSVGDAMLLRPMPFHQPDKLLYAQSIGDDGQPFMYGWPDYVDITAAAGDLGEFATYQRRGLSLAVGEETDHLLASPVTANYFSLLGVRAAAGHADVRPAGGQPQAVLGYRLWQRRFGGDPELVGKTVLLSRKPFLVAGVMPQEFAGLVRGINTDVWISADAWFHVIGSGDEEQSRSGQWEIVARLKPGIGPRHAASAIDAAIRGSGKHKPAPARVAGTSLDAEFAPSWKETLTAGGGLLLALALVLFVACANVAQLRLAQAESRKRELAISMALGAGAWRVTRQLMVETAIVSLAGASLGILIARFIMTKAGEFLSAGRTFVDYGIRLDARVLTFALAAMALSVVLSGLAPARHAVGMNVAEVIKSEQGVGGARGWLKKLLVVGQVAVSVALFGWATMFLLSLRNAAAVHPGLDPQKKLFAMSVRPGDQMEPNPSAWVSWCQQACDRLAAIPGVRGATFARRLPLSGSGGGMTTRVEVPGLAPMGVHLNNVGGNYFSLLGTRVVAGRGIEPGDRAGGSLVTVISQTLARQAFPGRNPVGEWLRVGRKARQVVGVAEDGPSNYLHEKPEPFLFLPFAQAPSDDITLMVETAGRPETLISQIRAELRRYDPQVGIYESQTLHQQLDQALSEDRMMASLSGGLGIFGIILTAAGLFGVLQYAVNRRTRELGLRMALGARPAEIQRLILGESLKMAAWGIPAGLMLLGAGGWYIKSRLLGVTPLDPVAYLASAAAALVLTLLAAWLPAARATTVDPMAALRSE